MTDDTPRFPYEITEDLRRLEHQFHNLPKGDAAARCYNQLCRQDLLIELDISKRFWIREIILCKPE